jgi:hypothetical protein
MRLIKSIRVGQERAETDIGAKVDRFFAIFDVWEIVRVCVDDASTKREETRWFRA